MAVPAAQSVACWEHEKEFISLRDPFCDTVDTVIRGEKGSRGLLTAASAPDAGRSTGIKTFLRPVTQHDGPKSVPNKRPQPNATADTRRRPADRIGPRRRPAGGNKEGGGLQGVSTTFQTAACGFARCIAAQSAPAPRCRAKSTLPSCLGLGLAVVSTRLLYGALAPWSCPPKSIFPWWGGGAVCRHCVRCRTVFARRVSAESWDPRW